MSCDNDILVYTHKSDVKQETLLIIKFGIETREKNLHFVRKDLYLLLVMSNNMAGKWYFFESELDLEHKRY